MNYGMTENDIKTIKALLRKFEDIDTAIVFGSRALGTYEKGSDVDIALKGNILPSTISSLKCDLEETTLPYFFDILEYATIQEPKLIEHIDQLGKIFYVRGWLQLSLGDISSYINRGIAPAYTDNGVRVINQRCIRDGRVNYNESRCTDPEVKNIPAEKYLEEEDILICSTGVGTLGRVGQINNIFSKTTVDSHVSIVRGNHKVNRRFLGYYLKCNEREIEHLAEGSTGQTELPRDKLKVFEIHVPSCKTEQKAIVDVLSSFDHKFELLRKQNKTLESIAETLFKEWFVDYKFPNNAGKPYKSSGGKMIDSEFGEIPDGWKIGTLDNFVNHIKEGVMPLDSPDTIFYHYSIPAYDENENEKREKGGEIKSNKYRVKKMSFLVSKLNPDISRIWTILTCLENAVCSTEFQVFTPKDDSYYSFLHVLLRTYSFCKELASRATGTSGSHQRVRPEDILSVEVFCPNADVLRMFNMKMLPLIEKIDANKRESKILIYLRDELLPTLMKGEVRVGGCI